MKPSTRDHRHLDAEVARLRASGTAFAVATVVRTVDATAAKPGAKALLSGEGTYLDGWIGGGCAKGAVARAARQAVATGQAQLISLRPEEILAAEGVAPGSEREGVRFAVNRCPSKGLMDIFVEPVLPLPRLVICGAGPVAVALAELAGRFDFHRILCAPGSVRDALPETEEWQDSFALALDGADGRHVVIATQGAGDEAALRAVMAAGAASIAFVGSRRKFATLVEKLAADGVDAAALAAVKAPAGVDIGAITSDEIALSILAQVIKAQRQAQQPGGTAHD